MKATSVFVNVSRGEVVDQAALYDALRAGRPALAAIDVCTPEPLPPDHRLLQLPNLLVTPHIGSATNETRLAMADLAVDNAIRALCGQPMVHCITGCGAP